MMSLKFGDSSSMSKENPNQTFVAMSNGQVIMSGNDPNELARKIVNEGFEAPVFIKRLDLEPKDETLTNSSNSPSLPEDQKDALLISKKMKLNYM